MSRTLFAAAVLFALATAGSAQAAFPGQNGKIVFRSNRTGNADVYTMNSDGTGRVNLTRNPAEDLDPRWSADGSRIVFASNRSGDFEIYTMAADGSDVRQVTSDVANAHRPSYAADGSIVFHAGFFPNRTIYRVNADGTGETALTEPGSDNAYAAPAPHGNRIAFSSVRDGTQRLYLMNGNGSAVKLVVAGPPGPETDDVEANWSPTGNDLVFVRFDAANGSDLYVVKANGNDLRQLTSTPDRTEFEPAWSPDGTKIVFHACGARCDNYVINADGTGETDVTQLPTAPFLDDFSSAPLEENWFPQVTGTGPTIEQTNGRLELTIPTSTTFDPSTGFANPAVFSRCNLRGDFDFQVDYSLLQWPTATNNVLATLTEGNFIGGTWMSANGLFVSKWGISGNFPDLPAPFVPGAFASGTLRLNRTGSILTSSYNVDGTWHTLQTRNDLVADESDATLSAFVNQLPTASGDVTIAFDNFRVNSGTFSCPTWWDDSAPDWQPN